MNTEVTSGLKEAPVPNLSRTQGGQIAVQTSASTMPGNVAVANTGVGIEDDEFADFQTAGPKSGKIGGCLSLRERKGGWRKKIVHRGRRGWDSNL